MRAPETAMPIYEYRCDACGHEFDELQKLADAPLTDCPSCGKPALIKKVSAAGFQLKGTGWYATDFRSKRKDEGRKEEGGAAKAEPTNAGPAKAEPAAKADAKAASAAATPAPKKADAKKSDV
jgi:putative FmdB family regulatory protein